MCFRVGRLLRIHCQQIKNSLKWIWIETQVQDKANSSHLTQWCCTHAFQAHAVSIRLTLAFYSILLATWGWKKNQNPSTKRRSKLAILLLDMWVRLNGIQMDMDQSVSKVTNVQFAQLMGGWSWGTTSKLLVWKKSGCPPEIQHGIQQTSNFVRGKSAQPMHILVGFHMNFQLCCWFLTHIRSTTLIPPWGHLLRQPWVESRKNMDISPRNTGTKPWKWWSKAISCHFPPVYVEMRWTIYISVWRAICFCFFFLFCGRFCIFFGFLVLCFPAFSAFLLSLLLCFCASVPFYFTILHVLFFSHVFLLLYFLLLCFSAPRTTFCFFLYIFCFIQLSFLYPRWSPKDPRWNPKKP